MVFGQVNYNVIAVHTWLRDVARLGQKQAMPASNFSQMQQILNILGQKHMKSVIFLLSYLNTQNPDIMAGF